MIEQGYRRTQYEWLSSIAPKVLDLPCFKDRLTIASIIAAVGSEARIEVPAFKEQRYLQVAVEHAFNSGLTTDGIEYQYSDYYLESPIEDVGLRVRCERRSDDKGYRRLKVIASKLNCGETEWDNYVKAEKFSMLIFNVQSTPNEADTMCSDFSAQATKVRERTEMKYNMGGYNDRADTGALEESHLIQGNLHMFYGGPVHRELAVQTISERVRLANGSFYENKLVRIEIESGTDVVTQQLQADLLQSICGSVHEIKSPSFR